MSASPPLRRQHPILIVVNSFGQLTEIVLLVVAYQFFGSSEGGILASLSMASLLTVVLLLSLGGGFLKWFFYQYGLRDDGTLEVVSGVLLRTHRAISRERVQSIDIEAGVVQQIFGLVALSIDTAGGHSSESEVRLRAITRGEAERIRSALKDRSSSAPTVMSEMEGKQLERPATLHTPSWQTLLLFAATSGRFGYFFVAVYAIHSQLPHALTEPVDRLIFSQLERGSHWALFAITFLIVLLSWVVSTVVEMLRYSGFSVIDAGSSLVVTHGLLKRHSSTIERDRIRAVTIKESFLRRRLGLATIYAEVNRGRKEGGEELVLLVPLVASAAIDRTLSAIIPGFPARPTTLQRPPRAALRRYLLPPLLIAIVVGIAALYVTPLPRDLITGAIAFGVVAMLAGRSYLAWRFSALGINATTALVRRGGLTFSSTLMPRRGVIGIEVRSNPLQRMARLCTVTLATASGAGDHTLAHAALSTAQGVRSWFSNLDRPQDPACS